MKKRIFLTLPAAPLTMSAVSCGSDTDTETTAQNTDTPAETILCGSAE